MRHVFSKYLRTRFVCVRHTRVRAFLQNSGQSNHAQYTNMVQQCCVTCQDIAPVHVPPILCFVAHDDTIEIPSHAQDQEHQHGTCAAGLPGICDVNLVCHTMAKTYRQVRGRAASLSPKSRPKVHLHARSAQRLRRNPPPAARTAGKRHRYLNDGRVP